MRGSSAVEAEKAEMERIKQIRAEENQAWTERRSWAFGYDFDEKFQTVVPYPYQDYDPLYDRQLYDLDLVELTVEQMLQLQHKREVNQCYDEFWEQKVIDAGFYGLDGIALFEQECAEQGHLGLDKEEFCLDQDYSEYFEDTEEDYQQYCAFIESLARDRNDDDVWINPVLEQWLQEKSIGLRRRLDWRQNKPGTKNKENRKNKNRKKDLRNLRRRTRGIRFSGYVPRRVWKKLSKVQMIEAGIRQYWEEIEEQRYANSELLKDAERHEQALLDDLEREWMHDNNLDDDDFFEDSHCFHQGESDYLDTRDDPIDWGLPSDDSLFWE